MESQSPTPAWVWLRVLARLLLPGTLLCNLSAVTEAGGWHTGACRAVCMLMPTVPTCSWCLVSSGAAYSPMAGVEWERKHEVSKTGLVLLGVGAHGGTGRDLDPRQ